ncbi:MAG: heavy-metal-associated domain-containing protein [Anaerolineales bacterium]|nr:heavy-metal-associated domain-containing protein [Chloroflexota bacterium]MBL7164247.1 heavy-metal-associated domain-containing protein [Anaerolineales bacterium]
MTVLTIDLPAMYGDHHVVEVRRILLDLDGVEEVYASSGFRAAEVTYNSKKVTKKDITARLDESGYIGELPIQQETGIPVNEGNSAQETFYRHTEAYEQTNRVVSFSQQVASESRSLWPCPGMAPIISMDE